MFFNVFKKSYSLNIALYLVDSLVWTCINIFPGYIIFKILKLRPWKLLKTFFNRGNLDQIALRLKNCIKKFVYSEKRFSSCLSKVVTSRIILDIFGIENIIKLGINKYSNGDKIPHAVIGIIDYKKLGFTQSEVVYLGTLDKVILSI